MFHNINKLQSNLNNYDRCESCDCVRLYNYFGDAHFLTFFKLWSCVIKQQNQQMKYLSVVHSGPN